MTFGLGGGALAALLVAMTTVVAGLYLLRPPPRRFLVSSTLLWQRAIEQRRRRLHDRRFWLSLLVSLVICWTLALALADPGWQGAMDRVVIVVDNSATMATRTSAGTTRLEEAVKRARSLARGARRVLVADACGRIGERQFEPRRTALRKLETLASCVEPRPTLPRLDFPDDSRAFLITDGVGLPEVPERYEAVSVFERAENVGIAAFAVRPVAGQAGAFEAYLAVVNQGNDAMDVDVQIEGSGRSLAGREHLEPGETVARAIALSEFASGGIAARIRADGDAYALDDVAYDFLPSAVIGVRLETQHPAVGRALGLAPDLEPVGSQAGEPAVVVADHPAAASSGGSAPHLYFVTDDEPVPLTGQVEIRAGHAMLRGVSPDDLIAKSAAALRPAEGETWLAWAGDTPLILVRETHPRSVRIALSLDDSALTRRASFPVLIGNAVRWLAGASEIGKPAPESVALSMSLTSIRGPEGEPVPMLSLAGHTVFEARRLGLFTAEAESFSRPFGIDFAHPTLAAPNDSALGPIAVEVPAATGPQFEAWRLLIALALVLVVLDRWAFSRRVMQ